MRERKASARCSRYTAMRCYREGMSSAAWSRLSIAALLGFSAIIDLVTPTGTLGWAMLAKPMGVAGLAAWVRFGPRFPELLASWRATPKWARALLWASTALYAAWWLQAVSTVLRFGNGYPEPRWLEAERWMVVAAWMVFCVRLARA